MACTATPEVISELQFVLALHTRSREIGECRGPVLGLELPPVRCLTLEQIFDSKVAMDVLWAGHRSDQLYGSTFSLCAAHWLDLAALMWMRAQQQRRVDFYDEADTLLRDVCALAGWDPKEIVNMFSWQYTRLT